MLTRADLERLANMRLEDAILLLQAGRASSAYYLAGYAVELAIKACITKLFQTDSIPDKAFVDAIYTHSLESLKNTAGLLPDFRSVAENDPLFEAYWGIASKWNERSRYELWDAISATTLIQAIADPEHGVFQWLKKHW